MSTLAYAAACLLLPSLWALAVYGVLGWIERRREAPVASSPRPPDEPPPIDYSI